MKTTTDIIRPSFVVVWVLLCSKTLVESLASPVPTMLKMEGNANFDLFMIPGKNCNTPTIIRQGRRGVFSRSKLIVIEPECRGSQYGDQMGNAVPVISSSYARVEQSMLHGVRPTIGAGQLGMVPPVMTTHHLAPPPAPSHHYSIKPFLNLKDVFDLDFDKG